MTDTKIYEWSDRPLKKFEGERVEGSSFEGKTFLIESATKMDTTDGFYYIVEISDPKKPGKVTNHFGTAKVTSKQLAEYIEDINEFPVKVKMEKPEGKKYLKFSMA